MIKKIFIVCFLILLPFVSKGQVTIGTDKPANPGAILDLKQENTSGANSSKGLLLPRVHLKDLNNLLPMFEEGYDKNTEDPTHTGLTVYNINNCFSEGAGPYAWDGEKWNYLIQQDKSEILPFEDQDGNLFSARRFGVAGIWMIQNLAATKFDTNRDSYDKTINSTNVDFKYPDGKKHLTDKYPWMGVFYNFATAINGSISDVNSQRIQGICPHGWHLPSSREWGELENELIENTPLYTTEQKSYLDKEVPLQLVDTITLEGTMKYGERFRAAALDPCPIPDTETKIDGISLKNTQGGFAIRMIGSIKGDDSVDGYGIKAGFWVASRTPGQVTGRNRVYIYNETFINNNSGDPNRRYSVRCKKNED